MGPGTPYRDEGKEIDRAVVTDGTITRIQGFKDAALKQAHRGGVGSDPLHPGRVVEADRRGAVHTRRRAGVVRQG